MNGLLIGIEGVDGCGKSTFAQLLKKTLEAHQIVPVLTREPGGTKFGLQLRQILQYRDEIGEIDPQAEYLLFAADRAQHFAQLVIPALEQGLVVISDRTGDSSLVYQGYGRGLDRDMIAKINAWAMHKIKPDLIIYLKIDLATAQKRVQQRAEKLTAFEQVETDFMQRLIVGFDTIYEQASNALILDGNLPAAHLAEQACFKILQLIALKKV